MAFENPDFVNKDLEYTGDKVNARMVATFKLLEEMPLNTIKSLLDIGMGRGEFSMWFAKKNIKVTGIGINLNSYNLNIELLKQNNIDIVECHVEKMPFSDESFDAVLLSHVLEHCFNLAATLKEIHRVLKKDGYLFVFVPEYTTVVTAAHAVIGWNLGQLLITLMLNGYDVKNGKFLHRDHQVCAFVRKSDIPLPDLRGDSGDSHTLYKAGLYPNQLEFTDLNFEFFEGNIPSLNWNTDVHEKPHYTKKQKLLIGISKIFPKVLLRKLVFYLRIVYQTLNEYWFTTKK